MKTFNYLENHPQFIKKTKTIRTHVCFWFSCDHTYGRIYIPTSGHEDLFWSFEGIYAFIPSTYDDKLCQTHKWFSDLYKEIEEKEKNLYRLQRLFI